MRRSSAAKAAFALFCLVSASSPCSAHAQESAALSAARVSQARVESMEKLLDARAGREITPRDLIELATIAGHRNALAVSPDGRTLLFAIRQASIAGNEVRQSWQLLDVETGVARLLADAGKPLVDVLEDGRVSGVFLDPRASFSPAGEEIAFAYAQGADIQMRVMPRDGGAPLIVYQGPGRIADFSWTPSGALEFTSETPAPAPPNETDQGYRFDGRFAPSASMLPLRASLEAPRLEHWRWRPGDNRAALIAGDTSMALTISAPSSARLVSINVQGAYAWADFASPDRSGVFAPLRLHAQRSLSEPAIACAAPDCAGDIEQVFWSRDRAQLYFVVRDASDLARRSLRVWDPNSGEVRDLLVSDDMLIDCIDTVRGIVCLREAPHSPRQIALISTHGAGANPTVLYDPNPGFAGLALGRVDRLQAVDAFGDWSFAHLVYPVNYVRGRPYPLVIVQYRWRGFLNGGIGGEYPIHVLAAHGYLVLDIDRPEARAQGAFLSADALEAFYARHARGRIMCFSVQEAYIDFLVRAGIADPTRIALTGLSDGADSVFYALMHSERYAAAIVSTPPSDPFDYYLSSAFNRRALAPLGGLDPFGGEDDSFWRAIAPFYSVERLHSPLLMNLAEDEALRATPFLARAEAHGAPVEAFVFAGEHHIKTGPRHLLAIQERNLAWLDFWLRGRDDDLDPQTRMRWQAIRSRRPYTGKRN